MKVKLTVIDRVGRDIYNRAIDWLIVVLRRVSTKRLYRAEEPCQIKHNWRGIDRLTLVHAQPLIERGV